MRITLPVLAGIALVATIGCSAISPEIKSSAFIRTQTHDAYLFDRTKEISVHFKGDPFAVNEMQETANHLLRKNRLKPESAYQNPQYSLQIQPVSKEAQYTGYESVRSSTTTGAMLDSTYVTLYGSTYTTIPVSKTISFNGFLAELWDLSNVTKPVRIWRGTIIAEENYVRDRKIAALDALIREIGKSTENPALTLYSGGNIPQAQLNITPQASSNYFPLDRISVLLKEGYYKNKKYSGYVRFEKVKTRYFEGFLLHEGLSRYKGVGIYPDEISYSSLGLGAYRIEKDGLYTTSFDDSQAKLRMNTLQKAIAFPITVGASEKVYWFGGNYLIIAIIDKEAVTTRAGKFSDCFKVKQTVHGPSLAGQEPDKGTVIWLCSGIGVAKEQNLSTGRLDLLVSTLKE